MELTGKVSIVTGGASGLGKAFSQVLLKSGCKVCIADLNLQEGEKSTQELKKTFGEKNVLFVVCDVTNEKDLENVFKETIKTFDHVDILVNNAGIGGESRWKEVVSVDLLGVIQGTLLALKFMGKDKGNSGGHVVNISSTAGLVPTPLGPVYCASKHGVVGYTRSMGSDVHYQRTGVKISAICPSFVNTPMVHQIVKLSAVPEEAAKFMKSIQLMEPTYVADALVKLLQDGKNGAILKVTKTEGFQYV